MEAGRLDEYGVLYTADPCIRDLAVAKIADWVEGAGEVWGPPPRAAATSSTSRWRAWQRSSGSPAESLKTFSRAAFNSRGSERSAYLDGSRQDPTAKLNSERSGRKSPSSPPPVKSWASSRTDHLRLSSTRSGKARDVRGRVPGHSLREGSQVRARRVA